MHPSRHPPSVEPSRRGGTAASPGELVESGSATGDGHLVCGLYAPDEVALVQLLGGSCEEIVKDYASKLGPKERDAILHATITPVELSHDGQRAIVHTTADGVAEPAGSAVSGSFWTRETGRWLCGGDESDNQLEPGY